MTGTGLRNGVWGLPRANTGPVPKPSRSPMTESDARVVLLDLDFRADFVEFLPDGFGLVLVDGFLEDLGHRLNEVLGFLQSEAGDFADDLDDVDLLVGREADERDVELGLLFGRRRRSRRRRRRRAIAIGIAAAADTPSSDSSAFTSCESSSTLMPLMYSITCC